MLRERMGEIDQAVCDGTAAAGDDGSLDDGGSDQDPGSEAGDDAADDAGSATGGLSFDHARVLADVSNPRVADALAELQSEIVALAQGSTFESWKYQVRVLVELLDADGVEPDDLSANKLSLVATLDGLCHLKGTLTADVGAAVRAALDAKADEQFRRFSRDRESAPELVVPDRSTLLALALAELCQIATGAEPGAGSLPRAELTLVLCDHDHQVTDVHGRPIPKAAADTWCCDPDMWAIMVDSMGVPLDAGHTHRLATIAQRRAIAIRDGGCTFLGCDAPIAWTDLHHLLHWQVGGETELENLAALCRHHHGVTHRNGWTMHTTPDQHFWWTTPTGHTMWGQRHHRRRPDPPPDHCPGCLGCRPDKASKARAPDRPVADPPNG